MNCIRKFQRVAIALAGAAVVFTPPFAWATTTYGSVTVSRLLIFQASSGAGPGSLIMFTPPIADSEGCTKSGQGYAWIDWTSALLPDGKSLYATVLAAEMAGKTIDIAVSGCTQGFYPLVYQIVVYP